ncbi:hypothetical protein SDC9_109476 [bioreactor metagenome]|uniref:Uncharacterized protein n=1 Tax=bioreactor metagenome TaxID=1076179 RepID=A0A645BAV8_9ZZZZ
MRIGDHEAAEVDIAAILGQGSRTGVTEIVDGGFHVVGHADDQDDVAVVQAVRAGHQPHLAVAAQVAHPDVVGPARNLRDLGLTGHMGAGGGDARLGHGDVVAFSRPAFGGDHRDQDQRDDHTGGVGNRIADQGIG